MKKQYWVNILILILISVLSVSCSTTKVQETIDNEVVATAIKLAQAKANLGQFEESQKVYETAVNHTVDYRLVYNWALSCAMLNDYSNAISLCRQARELYPDHLEFLDAEIEYRTITGDTEGLKANCIEYLKIKPNDAIKEKLMLLYLNDNELAEAYILALSFWYDNNYNTNALEVLNTINPIEWNTVYRELKK